MWGRDYRQPNADAFAAAVGAEVFITGHEPCAEGYQAPNSRQVIIDCCNEPACYAMLPLNAELSAADRVLPHVKYLHNSQPVGSAHESNGMVDDGQDAATSND